MTKLMSNLPLPNTRDNFAIKCCYGMLLTAWCFCLPGCKSIAKRDECVTCAVTTQPPADHGQESVSSEPHEQLAVQPAGYPFSPPVIVQPFPDPTQPGNQSEAQPLGPFDTEQGLTPDKHNLDTPPIISGTHLGAAQLTATEHALRLQAENEQLKSARESLLSDNQRLKQQAATSRELLNRMSTAITGAEQALQKAEIANQELARQVAEAQRQQKQDQLNADRMLQSIRDELDDVLMREISSPQK
jgi:hypothetical protein